MSREFLVTVPHSLSEEEALSRVKNLFQDLRKIYATQITDVREEWNGSTCKFSLKMFVFRIQGSVNVGSQAVEIRGKMPLGTAKYEDRVKMLIANRAKGLLAFKPKRPNPFEPPRFG
jgi:hypothetical protein